MKKVIAFSVWGKDEKYCLGAIENAKIAPEIYPGWTCRFYCGQDVPKTMIKDLIHLNAEIVSIWYIPGRWDGLFWRFYAASDSSVQVMISRDTDSILGEREKAAVDEWLESGLPFHIMRDHPAHCVPILGGMWGAVYPLLKTILRDIIDWQTYCNVIPTGRGPDQRFLAEIVWPIVKDCHIAHDEFFTYTGKERPFPVKGKDFVGKIIERPVVK